MCVCVLYCVAQLRQSLSVLKSPCGTGVLIQLRIKPFKRTILALIERIGGELAFTPGPSGWRGRWSLRSFRAMIGHSRLPLAHDAPHLQQKCISALSHSPRSLCVCVCVCVETLTHRHVPLRGSLHMCTHTLHAQLKDSTVKVLAVINLIWLMLL